MDAERVSFLNRQLSSSFAIGVRSALQANADVIVLAKPTDDELCEVALRAAHSALVLAEVPGRGCVPVRRTN